MYQALYRKWRPQKFSDMVGQEAIVRTLRNQVQTGHIAHAYLFCGSRGTGKTSAAKIMARAINCEHPVNGDPCGECAACKNLQSDTSLDVYEMDAASNSRVEEIRELLEKVAYPPQFGKYKVYIIDETHMLSNAAFNALLKTLEEPPAYMVFILATTEPQKIPATIISRCQRFDFGRFTEEQMISRISKALDDSEHTAEEGALQLIAQAAEGSMRDAWSLLDMCLSAGDHVTEEQVREVLGTADKRFLFSFTDTLREQNAAQALKQIDELMRSGRDVQVFLRDLSSHIRSVIAAKLLSEDENKTTAENVKRYQEQGKAFSMPHLLRLLELVMHAESDTRWASSARAVLEVCALRACQSPDSMDVTALLERIDTLEKRVEELQSGAVRISAPTKAREKTAAKPNAEIEIKETPLASGKTPKEIWNTMLGQMKKKDPSIFALFGEGKYGGCDNGHYKVLFEEQNAFYATSLNGEKRRPIIEQLLTETGGVPATFEASVDKRGADENAERKKQETENALVDTFGRDKVTIDEG